MAKLKEAGSDPLMIDAVDAQLVRQLADRARAEGLQLTGEGGLLARLTKVVIESALEGEMDDHLGYGKHERAGRSNARNGTRAKKVLTEAGPVEIVVPRDRDASFEPKIVKKRQRRLSGVDDLVISLSAKGLTTGEISAHLAEIYGAEVSRDTISVITDRVLDGMADWQSRPLDSVYPVLFIDCVNVKVRDGSVANRPIYVALAVTVDGTRDILGLWAGDGGEGAKYWMRVLAEIKNRGTQDVCIVVCDGLKGLPEAITTVWPQAVTQTCIVHLLRNSFRYASRRDWPAIARDLKPVYTAVSEQAALDAFAAFAETWEAKYPAIVRLWTNAWTEFTPFLAFDTEIGKDHLHHQRDRVHQLPNPPGRQRPRALSHRASGPQMRLPRTDEPRPHRRRPQTLDRPMENRTPSLRNHLRRPPRTQTPHPHQLDPPFS
ncbi:transposase-like protein [Longispora fulva]|uniref:Mutator family transposase n=1 Tax=Longispora fulva TaxID=619741 RepID=A0A8J7KKS3_9ACTN|nr:transposase-like protein [Longispora fulva]